MLDEKLLEVITSPPDSALAIITGNSEGPHVVNSWNSYIQINEADNLLLPAGRMRKTEANLAVNSRVLVTISNREVQGRSYKGTGFLITGQAFFETEGPDFLLVKAKFPWARAALKIVVEKAEQTL